MSKKEKLAKTKSVRRSRKGAKPKAARVPGAEDSTDSGRDPKASGRVKVESPATPPMDLMAVPYQGMALIPRMKPAAESSPEPKFRGKQGKLALTVDLAIDAVAATDYVLRKYTKAGGITERLRRMGIDGDAYFAKRSKK